jgi:glutathione S-transferase
LITLYTIPLSHSVLAAQLMLEYKGLKYRRVEIVSGLHSAWLRLQGFPRGTVPALRDGRERIQGTLAISRFLDRLQPDQPLFPRDPALRREVELAEAWGEKELQVVPRRLIRWALVHDSGARRMLVEANRLPMVGLMAGAMTPLAIYFARISNADETTVRRHTTELPALLDHADALVAASVIGAALPNAATFQIGPSLRFLMNFDRLEPLFSGRACARFARELLPDYPGRVSAPLPTA